MISMYNVIQSTVFLTANIGLNLIKACIGYLELRKKLLLM